MGQRLLRFPHGIVADLVTMAAVSNGRGTAAADRLLRRSNVATGVAVTKQHANLFRRRWKLTAALSILAMLAGVLAAMVLPPKYSANAQVVAVSPSSQVGVTGPTNPFLDFTESLNVTAGVLALAVTDDKTVKLIASQGGEGSYTVTTDASTSEPIIDVVATARSAAAARTTVDLVLAQLRSQLAERQRATGAPAKSFISLLSLGEPANPTRVLKSAIEIGLAVFGILLLLGMFLVLVFDRWRLRYQPAGAPRVQAEDAESADAAERTITAVPGEQADAGDRKPPSSRRNPFEIPIPQFRSRFKTKPAPTGMIAEGADAPQSAAIQTTSESTETATEGGSVGETAQPADVAVEPVAVPRADVHPAVVATSPNGGAGMTDARAAGDAGLREDDLEESDVVVIQAIIRGTAWDENDEDTEGQYEPESRDSAENGVAAEDAESASENAVDNAATGNGSRDSSPDTAAAGDATADPAQAGRDGLHPSAIVVTRNGMRLVRGRTKRIRYRVNGDPLRLHIDK
jgi:capsular polysaccharide biosynthesis protein